MGACGIGCSVGGALGVSVPCYIGGDGLCCSFAVLLLRFSANCSTAVLALGTYYKKGVAVPGSQRIVMISWIASVALYYDDRYGIATLLGNNWMVSEIHSPPVDVM